MLLVRILAVAAALAWPAGLLADGQAAEAPGDGADADFCYRTGLSLERKGDLAQAARWLQSALAEDPTLEPARLELAHCFAGLGWKDEALDQLRAYLDSGGPDASAAALASSLTREGGALGAFEAQGEPAPLEAAGPFSLGLELGYGWGFNSGSIGHRYNANANANSFAYAYDIGEGAAAALEADWSFTPSIALGLSVSPLLTGLSEAETVSYPTLGTSIRDSTTATQQAYPLLLKLRVRSRLGPRARISAFIGGGVTLASPYVESSTDVETAPAATLTSTVRYEADQTPGIAAAGGLGLELLLSGSCTAFLQASLTLAQVWASGATYSDSTTNAAGQVVGRAVDTDSYSASPPRTQSVDSTSSTAVSGGITTVTTTYDNGPTRYTDAVSTNGSGAVVGENFSETNVLPEASASTSYRVLAATVGLRWAF